MGKRFNELLSKYGLDVEGDFNKLKMQHQGSHPDVYHEDMRKSGNMLKKTPK